MIHNERNDVILEYGTFYIMCVFHNERNYVGIEYGTFYTTRFKINAVM